MTEHLRKSSQQQSTTENFPPLVLLGALLMKGVISVDDLHIGSLFPSAMQFAADPVTKRSIGTI